MRCDDAGLVQKRIGLPAKNRKAVFAALGFRLAFDEARHARLDLAGARCFDLRHKGLHFRLIDDFRKLTDRFQFLCGGA